MIRTIVTANDQLLQILLPDDFVGKLIEVIAFPVKDALEVKSPVTGKKKITVVSVSNKNFKFNRDELHER